VRLQVRLHLDEHLTPLPMHSWDVTVYDDHGDPEASWTALAGPFDDVRDALQGALEQVERYLAGRGRQGQLPLASPPR
jgi:hypothetical protein